MRTTKTEVVTKEDVPPLYYEQRMKALRKVTPESWDTFLDEVHSLLESLEKGNVLRIARHAVTVEDHMKQLRRVS